MILTDADIIALLSRDGSREDMLQEAARMGMLRGIAIGFGMSGDGYNAEYPFHDNGDDYEQDSDWIDNRDAAIRAAVGE